MLDFNVICNDSLYKTYEHYFCDILNNIQYTPNFLAFIIVM